MSHVTVCDDLIKRWAQCSCVISEPIRSVMYMLAVTFIGISILTLSTSDAVARDFKVSCPQQTKPLYLLGLRLTSAETPRVWLEIYQEANEAVHVLAAERDGLFDVAALATHDQKLACAHALALESALSLSDDQVKGRLWAARSIGHAVSLSSLDPRALKSNIAQQWLKLALERLKVRSLNTIKSQAQGASASISPPLFGEWRELKIKKRARPYQLSLGVTRELKWRAQCGVSEACQAGIKWRVYTHVERVTRILLPQADYTLSWRGPCVQRRTRLDLTQSATLSNSSLERTSDDAFTLTPPALRCRSPLTLIDAYSDEVIWSSSRALNKARAQPKVRRLTTSQEAQAEVNTRLGLPEDETLSFTLDGYQRAQARTPNLGAPLKVRLQRCEIAVRFEVTPQDSRVEGPRHARWGVPLTYVITRPGYLALKRTIELERPRSCPALTQTATAHLERAELSRSIDIIALNEEGIAVELSALNVGGVTIMSDRDRFARPEGSYRVEVDAKGYESMRDELVVPPCQTELCTPTRLELTLHRPPPPISVASRIKWTGGGLIASGLATLLFATQDRIAYEERLTFLDDLTTARAHTRTLRGVGLGILMSGVLTFGLGSMWPYISANDEE